jgi:hypothetical protein
LETDEEEKNNYDIEYFINWIFVFLFNLLIINAFVLSNSMASIE